MRKTRIAFAFMAILMAGAMILSGCTTAAPSARASDSSPHRCP